MPACRGGGASGCVELFGPEGFDEHRSTVRVKRGELRPGGQPRDDEDRQRWRNGSRDLDERATQVILPRDVGQQQVERARAARGEQGLGVGAAPGRSDVVATEEEAPADRLELRGIVIRNEDSHTGADSKTRARRPSSSARRYGIVQTRWHAILTRLAILGQYRVPRWRRARRPSRSMTRHGRRSWLDRRVGGAEVQAPDGVVVRAR